MRLVVAGRTRDVRGFALAGIDTISCETAMEAQTALDGLGPDVGVFMVSQWFERATRDRLARLRERTGPPVVLVLPPAHGDDAGHR